MDPPTCTCFSGLGILFDLDSVKGPRQKGIDWTVWVLGGSGYLILSSYL